MNEDQVELNESALDAAVQEITQIIYPNINPIDIGADVRRDCKHIAIAAIRRYKLEVRAGLMWRIGAAIDQDG